MLLIEMIWDLAVHCGSTTKFLLSTACAFLFTMSNNIMVAAVDGCREILVEDIGLERVNIAQCCYLNVNGAIRNLSLNTSSDPIFLQFNDFRKKYLG